MDFFKKNDLSLFTFIFCHFLETSINKSAFSADAEYINRICGKKVTTANSLSRSLIFTKITGEYPNCSGYYPSIIHSFTDSHIDI